MDVIPISPERKAALEEYARTHGKDPAQVADDALAKYLDYESWFANAVAEGLAAANRGEFIEHEEVGRLIDSRYPG
jgi:predicted transcriptional regulator